MPYEVPSLSLSDLERLANLMLRMQSSFPNQELTDEMALLWREDWSRIALEHGMTVLEEAVDLHRRSTGFLPSRHDMERHVRTILEERQHRDSERSGRRATEPACGLEGRLAS